MITSLQTDLILDEGVRTRPYKDSLGVLTIGIGHNLIDSGLCPEAITAQLTHDLNQASDNLHHLIPTWTELPFEAQRVLLNLSFNLGSRLAHWPIFLRQMEERNFAGAAANLRANTVYVKQVGERANRLASRLDSVV